MGTKIQKKPALCRLFSFPAVRAAVSEHCAECFAAPRARMQIFRDVKIF
ncbi:hypothetical protein [Paraburkholderia sacchari]